MLKSFLQIVVFAAFAVALVIALFVAWWIAVCVVLGFSLYLAVRRFLGKGSAGLEQNAVVIEGDYKVEPESNAAPLLDVQAHPDRHP